jgi:coiled-coil domain-containing protein 55
LTDVSKQKDLAGFYHHLYKQAVGVEDYKDNIKMKQDEVDKNKPTIKDTSDTVGTSKSEDKEQAERKTARQYRKRRNSSESEKDANGKAKLKRNIDADADLTGHSSGNDSSENEEDKEKKENKNTVEEKSKPEAFTSGSEEGEIRESYDAKRDANKDNSELLKEKAGKDGRKLKSDEIEMKEEEKDKRKSDEKEADKENIIAKPEPPKRSIWEKRTVGPVFEAALERYFARKAAKSVS